MAVFVEWTITAGLDPAKEVVTALKRLRYTEPRPDWGQEPNRNPELTGIRFSGLYDAAANMLVNPIEGPAEVPLLLPVQQSVFVEPILADGAVETDYVTAVATSTSDPTPVWTTVARERLRFAFLATAGTFRPAVTSSELGPLREPGQTVFFASEYHLPGGNRRPADGRVTIWIVARDERGGVGWTRREIQLPP
jgi:hypothetical protein